MIRKQWTAILLGLIVCLVTNEALAAERPNVIVLLADDLGWKDLGCYGATNIHTPNIDRLASEGVRFAQFYANGPECTPTRAAFLTGRYQQRVGGLECAIGIGSVGRYDDAIRLAAEHELGLPTSELTISRLLGDAGYGTAVIGKWHLGYDDKFAPNRHGFDYAFYAQGGGMDYFHHVEDPPTYTPVLRLNGDAIQRDGSYFTDLIADEAIGWLRRHMAKSRKTPYFLYVPFTAPHAPYQSPKDKLATPLSAESDRWRQGSASPKVYAEMIESMDAAIGRILAELGTEEAGNTLVIFASDNGGTASARPTPLRGSKGTTFEGGIRVPCIMRWPGKLPSGTEYSHPAMLFDVSASLARLAGIEPSRPFDGIDIVKSVAAGEMPPKRSMYWRQRRGDRTWRAVREGSLKYVSEARGDKREEFLFDLAVDEPERNDLFEARPDDVQRLIALLQQWEQDVKPSR